MTCKTTNRYVEAMCPAVAQAATFQKKKKKKKKKKKNSGVNLFLSVI